MFTQVYGWFHNKNPIEKQLIISNAIKFGQWLYEQRRPPQKVLSRFLGFSPMCGFNSRFLSV
jgi:hypothetical protein